MGSLCFAPPFIRAFVVYFRQFGRNHPRTSFERPRQGQAGAATFGPLTHRWLTVWPCELVAMEPGRSIPARAYPSAASSRGRNRTMAAPPLHGVFSS